MYCSHTPTFPHLTRKQNYQRSLPCPQSQHCPSTPYLFISPNFSSLCAALEPGQCQLFRLLCGFAWRSILYLVVQRFLFSFIPQAQAEPKTSKNNWPLTGQQKPLSIVSKNFILQHWAEPTTTSSMLSLHQSKVSVHAGYQILGLTLSFSFRRSKMWSTVWSSRAWKTTILT